MKIHPDSHMDHGISADLLDYIQRRYAGRSEFFVETFEIPGHMQSALCALWGPLMGDAPVQEADVSYVVRGNRAGPSRFVDRGGRFTRKVTVIAGPHAGEPCVLYTAFGGPQTPREPWDPGLTTAEEREESRAFWAQHALGVGK